MITSRVWGNTGCYPGRGGDPQGDPHAGPRCSLRRGPAVPCPPHVAVQVHLQALRLRVAARALRRLQLSQPRNLPRRGGRGWYLVAMDEGLGQATDRGALHGCVRVAASPPIVPSFTAAPFFAASTAGAGGRGTTDWSAAPSEKNGGAKRRMARGAAERDQLWRLRRAAPAPVVVYDGGRRVR